ncbi:signal peptidase I [Aeromicrobium duanguangcaii]|uniref:Signal peptidase I n=1 Tax=Aeromicrobium duanguangcaii TaxID=2968086 RepID=A0ABY5KNA1_9ACTN|nr:signal peptidase I [Aeromicrobium duanguangcaii]MCD9153080.1 signal peptidase I [Aeromicrobium duanguangcaii]UUI69818.1 signal peptidase I [Aeromicrobium duanguangcaii]
MRRGLGLVGNVVLWVAAVLGAISMVLALATVVAGVQPLIFRSSSMAPAVDAGALALARSVDAQDVKPGDIVSVVNSDGVRVTHRVVKVDQGAGDQVSLTLKGDSNRSPDEEKYLVAEVDRVFFDVPYLGYVANWLASPWAMFAAGIVVALLLASLWSRRSGSGGASAGPGAGTGAGALVAIGLAAASLAPVPRTEAYFSDPATFEAGTVQAHQVRIFDWDAVPCTTNAAGSVTLRYKITSPRYDMTWYRGPKGGAISGTPFLTVVPTTSTIGAVVATTITRAALAGGQPITEGTHVISGRSKLKGAATSAWLSASDRQTEVTVDATTVRCGDINLPPVLAVTGPLDGTTYPSTGAIDDAIEAICGQAAPCGKVTDPNGVYSVEYRLQRANWLSTQCWNPQTDSILPPGFYLTGCGTWRSATTSPVVPNLSGSPLTWQVPIGSGGPGTTFNQAGDYTLYLRITDNASPTRATTERTIRFTVR